MRYTPVELRHVKVGRSTFGGYKRHETDKLLEDVADSFEVVWRERGELGDKLEDVERILAEVKQRESLLASTLVAAEKASAEVREAAKHEAELIVAEAHHEARAVTRAAHASVSVSSPRYDASRRCSVPPSDGRGDEQDLPAASPGSDQWPRREDTREFQAVRLPEAPEGEPKLPPVQSVPDDPDDGSSEARDFAWG